MLESNTCQHAKQVKEASPLKRRPRGGNVRLTNHKTRSKWFQARSSWPVREAPVNRLVARTQRELRRVWLPAKDVDIGMGMCRSRERRWPSHEHRLSPETSGASLDWRRRRRRLAQSDGGRMWKSCWNDQDVLNIGSLAIDERNPEIIYCGTGEANLSSDCYPGVGLYRSTDAGKYLETACFIESHRNPARHRGHRDRSVRLETFLIGGVGFDEVSAEEDSLGGIYASDDSGESWQRETFISTSELLVPFSCFPSGEAWRRSSRLSPNKDRAAASGVQLMVAKSGIN